MTRTRRILFSILLLLVPLIFLALVELALRFFDLFPQEPFILTTQKAGREYYQFNQWVAKRYFDPGRVTVPGLQPEKFAQHKDEKTFRILCLGESTTAGFPFDCQVPFPVQLRHLLSQGYPQHRFEVLNTGISAVSSYTVLDLLPDMLALQPDLIIIYMGHNEFYGAYGSASTIALGQNGAFIRFYLKLQKLHLVQMLKRIISELTPAQRLHPANRSLMAGVIQDQSIPYRSEKYLRTLQNFTANLDLILTKCARSNVPVLMSNLVANIRDLPPFASENPKFLDMASPAAYQVACARGDSLAQLGRNVESAAHYQKALALDSSAAHLWFKLGRTYAALSDSTTALHFLQGARDRDVIRFRAGSEINALIWEMTQKHSARFVDMERWFARHSPQGLAGSNLMVDHLHPDPQGYFLMALAFYENLQASGILKNPEPNFKPAAGPYHVTALDWDIGRLKVFEMIHHWPFPEKAVTLADYQPSGDSLTAAVAQEYLFVNNVWSRAHYKLAEEYIKRNDLERARAEYLAVSLFAPADPYPYQQVAKTYEMEKAWDQREAFLLRAVAHSEEKGMMFYQIAMAQWQQKKLGAACQSMISALDQPDLNHAERQNARFYLAGFYADAGNFEMTKKLLVGLLQEDPNFHPARIFLQRLGISNERLSALSIQ